MGVFCSLGRSGTMCCLLLNDKPDGFVNLHVGTHTHTHTAGLPVTRFKPVLLVTL